MDILARVRPWSMLPVVLAIALHSTDARAGRVDINDPLVLGPVLLTRDFANPGSFEDYLIRTEVRYAAGTYSYIYAVQSNGEIPGLFGQRMLTFSVSGHPLEETWGAIHNSNSFWRPGEFGEGSTYLVDDVRPIHDGFIVIPETIPERGRRQDRSRFAVIYVQSPLPPAIKGTLIYRGAGGDCDGSTGECFDLFATRRFDGVPAPVPEPASIVLFGLGLGALVARTRANRHRPR